MVGSPEHSLKIVLIVRDINQFECIVFFASRFASIDCDVARV